MAPDHSLQGKWACPNWLRLTKIYPWTADGVPGVIEVFDILSKEDLAGREIAARLIPNRFQRPELEWMPEDPLEAPPVVPTRNDDGLDQQ